MTATQISLNCRRLLQIAFIFVTNYSSFEIITNYVKLLQITALLQIAS